MLFGDVYGKIGNKTKAIVVIVVSILIAGGTFASILTFNLFYALAPKDQTFPWFVLSISITALLVIGELVFLLTYRPIRNGITLFLMSFGFSIGLVSSFFGVFGLARGPVGDVSAWIMLVIGIIFLSLGVVSTAFFIKFRVKEKDR